MKQKQLHELILANFEVHGYGDESDFGFPGITYILKVKNGRNAYRIFNDIDNRQLGIQYLAVSYDYDGGVGYDDAVDCDWWQEPSKHNGWFDCEHDWVENVNWFEILCNKLNELEQTELTIHE